MKLDLVGFTDNLCKEAHNTIEQVKTLCGVPENFNAPNDALTEIVGKDWKMVRDEFSNEWKVTITSADLRHYVHNKLPGRPLGDNFLFLINDADLAQQMSVKTEAECAEMKMMIEQFIVPIQMINHQLNLVNNRWMHNVDLDTYTADNDREASFIMMMWAVNGYHNAWMDKIGKLIQDKTLNAVSYGDFVTYYNQQVREQRLPCIIRGDKENTKCVQVIGAEIGFNIRTGAYVDLTVVQYALKHNGQMYELVNHVHTSIADAHQKISDFDNLKIVPMVVCAPTDLEAHAARGAKYLEFTKNPHYKFYEGNVAYSMGWWGIRNTHATGRVMVDAVAFNVVDPNYRGWPWSECYDDNVATMSDELLPFMVNRVYGFSFRTKSWGELDMDSLSEIAFREDAFERMVLDQSIKDHVRDLACSDTPFHSDLVDDKGGGLIFLCSGNPGTGKTLMAETVAEVLKRPLYDVGVDELGVTPDQVEENLKNVLNIAHRWNAILLINEADVYLEERNVDNIERNAIVSVFLRLMEYYKGILFLTTNRGNNLDPAVRSRMTMHMSFPDMTDAKLSMIWQNHTHPHESIDADMLVEYAKSQNVPQNGRLVKNLFAQGRRIAAIRKQTVDTDLMKHMIDMTTCSPQ